MSDLVTCFLSTGSNLGDRLHNLAKAEQALAQQAGKVVASSSYYQTAAWGVEDQAAFLNQVLRVQTRLSPNALLDACQAIENRLGRVRTRHWGERLIDIDILYYGQQIIDQPNLQIPHPFLHERRFVLVPLQEIAPDWQHPTLLDSTNTLLKSCPDQLAVEAFQPKVCAKK